MIVVRFIVGAATALAGVWTLADIPVVNPAAAIAFGWTLLLVGALVLTPALLDLLGVDE